MLRTVSCAHRCHRPGLDWTCQAPFLVLCYLVDAYPDSIWQDPMLLLIPSAGQSVVLPAPQPFECLLFGNTKFPLDYPFIKLSELRLFHIKKEKKKGKSLGESRGIRIAYESR